MHTPRHRARGRRASAAPILLALLAGCAQTTPQLDRHAGDAVRTAFAQQVAFPGAVRRDAVAGMDGASARAALERYQKSFSDAAPPPVVFSIGGGK
ncbi:hypothetical protein [Janthinobacterium fluminis]|uniref:Pilus assembly protein n=1 Tax=Janthinobacterium fluminis TaxID=2987524 RepID=A0ABT5K7V3_9BURK|nr:hypothetical protein [Janthinobacterium fluminis]MDC8760498.1 hypothetical protein [Janthinobacterium fluminis]